MQGVLRPENIGYVQSFLKINDQEEFQKRIFTTIREMFTVIKNQDFAMPATKGAYAMLA